MGNNKNLHSYISRAELDAPRRARAVEAQPRPLSSLGPATRRSPLHLCAISHRPHRDPVIAPDGAVFESSVVVPLVRKTGVHPLRPDQPLQTSDLTPICFSFFADIGQRPSPTKPMEPPQYQCPALCEPFTPSTVVVAVAPRGIRVANVYSWRAVQQLNIATGNFVDLVDGTTPFALSDVVLLQGDVPEKLRNVRCEKLSSDPASMRTPQLHPPSRESGAGVDRLTLPPMRSDSHLGNVTAARPEPSSSDSHGKREPPSLGSSSTDVALCGDASRILSRAGVKRRDAYGSSEHFGSAAGLSATAHVPASEPPPNLAEMVGTEAVPSKKRARQGDTNLYGKRDSTHARGAPTLGSPSKEASRQLAENETRSATYKRIRKGRKGKGYVRVHSTVGHLNVELHCDKVPFTCDNFLQLAARGFFDGLTWHRIVPGVAAETGDPTGTGTGGESTFGTSLKDEVRSSLKHDAAGVVSMVKTSKGALSQWRITFAPLPALDGLCTVFGKVVGDRSALTDLERSSSERSPCIVERIEVLVDPIEQIRKEIGSSEAAKPVVGPPAASSNFVRESAEQANRGHRQKPKPSPGDGSEVANVSRTASGFGDFSSWS